MEGEKEGESGWLCDQGWLSFTHIKIEYCSLCLPLLRMGTIGDGLLPISGEWCVVGGRREV